MKHVRLESLNLENFQGVKQLAVTFQKETTICGDNATGKTRLFDSFIWLLFGKDSLGRCDYRILNIENEKECDRVDAEVTGVLLIDGERMILRRVYRQKWQRKKGDQVETMTGYETLYYINDVPLKAGEYKARITAIIDETVFTLITNPAYFLSLKKETQRDILLQIGGTLSDAEIAATNADFQSLLDEISGKSLTLYRREINARMRKLKDDLEMIDPKIKQTKKLMPEERDFEELEIRLEEIQDALSEVDRSIADRSEAMNSQFRESRAKQQQVNELRSRQQKVAFEEHDKRQKEAFERNAQRRDIEFDLTTVVRNLKDARDSCASVQNGLSHIRKKIAATELEIEELRQSWFEENAKEYEEKANQLICPLFNVVCSESLAISKHEQAIQAAKETFAKNKQQALDAITEKGIALAEVLNRLKSDCSELETKLTIQSGKVDEYGTEHDRLQRKLQSLPIVEAQPVVASELPEWQELEKQITTIQSTIEDHSPVDTSDLLDRKKQLEAARDQLKELLGTQKTIEQYKEEVLSLEQDGRQLSQQISDLERTDNLIKDFSKVKISECEKRVNNMFQIVRFQLFDSTIENRDNEDKTFETCIPKNKTGVPINGTNTAEKVNAGLDIINALCRFHNVTAPIFIDCRESVNELISTESQIINLIVTRDKSLVIK